jgi:hypothetical protein
MWYRKVDDEVIYVHSRLYPWGKEKHRCDLHLYYNATNRAKDVDKFNEELLQYKGGLESGKPVADHQKAYDDFLIRKTTPKRGLLQEMKTLTKVKYSWKYGHILTEVTKAQRDILKALEIQLPGMA